MIEVNRDGYAKFVENLHNADIHGNPVTANLMSVMQFSHNNQLVAQAIYTKSGTIYQIMPDFAPAFCPCNDCQQKRENWAANQPPLSESLDGKDQEDDA